jgi:mannose-6-phosphate isomerase-like protein (cupin superfamily)
MRRVVIGENKEGKSVVLSDGKAPRCVDFNLVGSKKYHFMSEIWATDNVPTLPVIDGDLTVTMDSFVPPPGGTRCRLLFFPTEKTVAEIQRLAAEHGSGFVEEFNKQAPGFEDTLDPETHMHITDSIDYGFIVSGQIDLELDDGIETHLKAGDAYVLQGTRHSWHNRYDEPCIFVVFLIGTYKRA